MKWKLKDLTVDGKGSYGIGAPAIPYQEDKLTYLRITDINDDGSLNFSDLKSVDAEDAEKYILKENDIVFARTGNSTGRSYFYEKQHGTFVYAGFLIKFSLDPNKVNPRILKYYTHSKPYFDWVNSFDTGATRGNINAKTYGDMEIELPSRKVQDKIVSILSSLDRKIELNNKINADLEEMAQAIFKNWFVDFEPFKDGKFVDSELGMIPEGWKVGSYSEMIESLISGDWGKENPQGNYTHEVACVRGCDFQDINNGVRGKTPQRYILEKNYQAKHLKDKDILVEISGGTATVSTGRTSLVTEELLKKYKHDIVCTNFCKVLRPLSQFSSYVYYSWKHKYDNDIMFGFENGTSGIKNFAIKDFIEKEPVLIPKEQDIVEFQKIIDNLQKQKQIKGTENTTLSTLRDTLLPRLMSGELEVPE